MPLNKPRDARSLDHTTLEELRRLGVKRVLAGETQAAVAASLEIHPGSVARWMAQYREGGEQSLASTVSTGRPSKLTPKQVAQLRAIIIGKNPQQLNFGLALWTLPVIRQLIERKFGVVLHDSNIGRLLHRIGLSVQRPQRRAFTDGGPPRGVTVVALRRGRGSRPWQESGRASVDVLEATTEGPAAAMR